MIRQYELIDKIRQYNDKADVALVNRAYVFSMKAHGNQKRASGEPYLTHPLEVAAVLAEWKMDEATICTGLLHDTLEDTLATYDELKQMFGQEIADLTEGVTKLSRISFTSKSVEQAENFRKLFLAMSKDIRVLLVKLADRLHNMRTIDHMKKQESKERKARETLDIFVPLADRIGLYMVKIELEDISFRILQPEEYEKISARMAFIREQDHLIEKVVDELKDELAAHGIKGEVSGREKTHYSIYRKMLKKNLSFDQLTDIVAYRIVVDDLATCYETLGMIHNLYKAIPGRFKDYISNRKANGYQSLHTSVIGPFAHRVEIQIRTREMHEIAEYGVAAHWLYKQQGPAAQGQHDQNDGGQYKWLKQLLEVLQSTDDPEEFLENTKLNLFTDEVFVFTPKGDLVSLPQGATPLDFAYYVHSEVGHHCQAAKINGRIVPLRTKLKNGDQVDVVTSNTQKPNPGWRQIATTAKARTAINRYLRAQAFDAQVKLGHEMLEKAARREGHALNEKELPKVAEALKQTNVDELYAGLAQGRVFPRQIFAVLYPADIEPPSTDPLAGVAEGANRSREEETAIGIDGLVAGMAVHIAGCCHPLPGEPIVGIIHTGRGVTIHSRDCRNLEQFADEPDRWMPVKWNDQAAGGGKGSFTARMRINMAHVPGALSNVTTTIFNQEGNIVDLHIESKFTDSYDVRCDIEVRNLEHLEKMLAALRSLKCVNIVERVNG